ncbi:penicillin-binding protein 1C [Spirochaeta lutea]|uniref:penicillin-binding protein 1C n=1 Tax=Spirochaeta lutea TaxID=1480694 RepID=UPI00068C9667|nr:penicillin-binding protein 1C [Spirochaeta lutea]
MDGLSPRRIVQRAVIAVIVIAGLWLGARFQPFPEVQEFLNQPLTRVFLDNRGGVLYRDHLTDGTEREWTDLNEIPRGVIRAFLAGEDSRYYLHPGVDPASMLRAALQNLGAGSVVSGASTITMQLARLITPHRGGIRGKLTEAWNALRLETRFSKDEILELYLNRVPFGRGAEGVTSAARKYFGVSIDSMSPARAVVLSILPRSPSAYDPRENPLALLEAAGRVAEGMTPPISHQALARAVEDSRRALPVPRDFSAPHLSIRLAQDLPRQAGGEPADRSRIRTTIDPDIQGAARGLFSQALYKARESRIHNGAVLVVHNQTGEVRAYVGSGDFFDDEHAGQIDGVRIRRQPGSTLKPFLYAMAMEEGYTAASILPDIPLELGGAEVYIPLNFDNSYSGPVRLREALASSLNVPAVWTVSRLGVQNFASFLQNLGMDIEDQREGLGTGIALGNVEVTLEELTRAYTSFTNQGSPRNLRYLLPSEGKSYSNPVAATGISGLNHSATGILQNGSPSPISPEAAGIIRDILSDSGARTRGFGDYQLLKTKVPSFFKTGTANQFTNIWAVGASPEYTVGVWMGNVHGQTVQGTTGSSLPAWVAVEILEAFTPPGTQFPEPPNTRQVWVSAISGMAVAPSHPFAISELVPLGVTPPQDNWHREDGSIVYPPEFQPWALDALDLSAQTWQSPGQESWARILQPLDGAQFFDDPYLRLSGSQSIGVRAIGTTPEAVLYHNTREVARGALPLATIITPHGGSNILKLVSPGDGTVLHGVVFYLGREGSDSRTDRE